MLRKRPKTRGLSTRPTPLHLIPAARELTASNRTACEQHRFNRRSFTCSVEPPKREGPLHIQSRFIGSLHRRISPPRTERLPAHAIQRAGVSRARLSPQRSSPLSRFTGSPHPRTSRPTQRLANTGASMLRRSLASLSPRKTGGSSTSPTPASPIAESENRTRRTEPAALRTCASMLRRFTCFKAEGRPPLQLPVH